MSTASVSLLNAQDAEWEHAYARSAMSGTSTPLFSDPEDDMVSVAVPIDAGDDEDAWEGIYDTDSENLLQPSQGLVTTPQAQPAVELVPSDGEDDRTFASLPSHEDVISGSPSSVLYTFPDPLSTLSLEGDLHLPVSGSFATTELGTTISDIDTELLSHLDEVDCTPISPSPPKRDAASPPSVARSPVFYATGFALATVLIACVVHSCGMTSVERLPAVDNPSILSPRWSDALLHSFFGANQAPSPVIPPPSSSVTSADATASPQPPQVPSRAEKTASGCGCTRSNHHPARPRCSSLSKSSQNDCGPSAQVRLPLSAAEAPLLIESANLNAALLISTTSSRSTSLALRHDHSLSPYSAVKTALSLAINSLSRFIFRDLRDALRVIEELLQSLRQRPYARVVMDFIAERHNRAKRNARKGAALISKVVNGEGDVVLHDAVVMGLAVWEDLLQKVGRKLPPITEAEEAATIPQNEKSQHHMHGLMQRIPGMRSLI